MHDLQAAGGGPLPTEDLVVGYVGGGSGSWAPTLMNDLARCTDLAGEVRLYDLDPDRAARNARLGNRIQEREAAVGDWTYEAVDSLRGALDGADFVVCSTQDPPGETMVHDLDIPREYGIYQTVGDTVGPGGILRGMRAIPQYREIAAAVREHCPDAWVLNHTNPMTVVTRTLYEEYPDINAVGLCHEVFKVQRLYAELIGEYRDVEEPHWHEVDVDVKGINHFTWVDGARWHGEDVLELVDRRAADRPDPPSWEPGDLGGHYGGSLHDVTFDLYDRFGVLPCAGDRHLAEFVPWYLTGPEAAERWGTPVKSHSEPSNGMWERQNDQRDAILRGDESLPFRETQEEAIDIMCALAGGTPVKSNANLPNVGQTSDLPAGAVVETNCLFTGDDAAPLTAGDLPPAVRTLVTTHVRNQELLVEAGFEGDLDLAYQAFCNDPLVTVDSADARTLFAEMVRAERRHLDDWNVESASVMDG